jgi:hypothetical protein
MEVEQMMACLLEEMGTIQAKADANQQELKENIKADQAKVDASLKELRAAKNT